MSKSLIITLILTSVFLVILTTIVLKKGRISEKHSLLWYAFALVILLVGIFPSMFTFISNILGFELMSNFIIAVIIGSLLLLTMALTIMIAGQKKKTTMLIQEISILKNEVKSIKNK